MAGGEAGALDKVQAEEAPKSERKRKQVPLFTMRTRRTRTVKSREHSRTGDRQRKFTTALAPPDQRARAAHVIAADAAMVPATVERALQAIGLTSFQWNDARGLQRSCGFSHGT